MGFPWQPPLSVVVTIAWPWWSLLGLLSCFPSASFCALPWTAISALDQHSWASFASVLDLVWPHILYFILTLGSICVNRQSEPEQAKTKLNRRNIGMNCKIMHINPKFSPNHLKYPCIYDTYQLATHKA